MRFGICAKIDRGGELKSAGADFVEENVQTLLQGLVDDGQWRAPEASGAAALPLFAANSLVPGDLKIVGESVDFERLGRYIANVTKRARQLGIKLLVFGSGGARNVPEGFDRQRAFAQIVAFCRMAADHCKANGIMLVAEPLNHAECNIINTVPEAMTYVKAVDHPNFQCLVDSYHFWLENERLEDLVAAMPWIRHVHVSDKDGRVAPGESGKSDFRPFFRVLKKANYSGAVSVEALGFNDFVDAGPRVLAFLKRQWQDA
jgi:sugar phosphate isomerase/epimerase